MSGLREALEELLREWKASYATALLARDGDVLAVDARTGTLDDAADLLEEILAEHPDDSVTEWGVVYVGSYSVRVDWGYASDPTPLIDAEGEFDLGAGSWVRPIKVVSRISSPVKTVWEAT